MRSTTIVAVRRNGVTALACDGQVTLESTIMKSTANKLRRIYKDQVVVGFAGSVADAFALFERLEGKLEEFAGNLRRASVELAKEWRTNKYLRELKALLIAADSAELYILSGSGEVIEPEDEIAAIGSGGPYALAAARALAAHAPGMDARQIAVESLKIAAGICVYTNDNIQLQVIE